MEMEKEKKKEELKSDSTKKTNKKKQPLKTAKKMKSYPIVLVTKTHFFYMHDSGTLGWKAIESGEKYKVSEKYESAE